MELIEVRELVTVAQGAGVPVLLLLLLRELRGLCEHARHWTPTINVRVIEEDVEDPQ